MSEQPLSGKVILIAEDEYVIAADLRQGLTQLGATVLGPVPSLQKALDLIGTAPHIDMAVLDINLQGTMVFPVADLLQKKAVPFVFATGYDQSMIPDRFSDVTRCEKPLSFATLVSLIA